MEIQDNVTNRGFALMEFHDRYGQACDIQKSSLATDDAIWFGVTNTGDEIRGPGGNYREDVNSRMHLTRDQVQAILPILIHFSETGNVRHPDADLTHKS